MRHYRLLILLLVIPLLTCRYTPETWTIRLVANITDSHGVPLSGQRVNFYSVNITRDGRTIDETELDASRTTGSTGDAVLVFGSEYKYDRTGKLYTEGVRATAYFTLGGHQYADTTEYFPSDTIPDRDVIVPLSIALLP